MSRGILTINAGSSSIKFALFPLARPISPTAEVSGQIDGIGTAATKMVAKNQAGERIADQTLAGQQVNHAQAFDALLKWFTASHADWEIVAVGHRVVHGGDLYSSPTIIDAQVLGNLAGFVPLAPLHQPHNVAGIEALQALLPKVPQVACFDTAFHRDQPPIAQAFALPAEITDAGVRRYGFHGLSYEYVAGAMRTLDMRAAAGRVVVAHLGNGASMCAMANGRSVASTMGFTALDGLVMGTRTGTIDPGVLLWLMDERGMGARDLERLLYHRSGLLGVSGISSDMRTLLASDDPRAKLAVELFCYRAGRELGSLVATLGGLDALVFTGGIGEHAAPIRAAIVRGAGWLGLALDEAANAAGKRRITADTSKVPAYVVPTDEELMIARHVRSVMGI